MDTVSIIIPSRNERFLQHTIKDILKNAQEDIEIIAILDGYWSDPPLEDSPRLKILHIGKAKGMRNGINQGVAIAKGKYIMKLDGHCMVGEGFDKILKADCEDNWVVVPRRKRLDAENWCIQDVGKPDIDYMYLSYPDNPNDFGGSGLNGKVWKDKNGNPYLEKEKIVDLMSAQGSCWFMKKKYFQYLELMDEKNYGQFWNEFQEIGLNCWLSGGRVVRNKNTFYAHLYKGKKYGRGYQLHTSWLIKGRNRTMKWFHEKGWHKQTKPLSWLIEHFSPVPTWTEEGLKILKENEKQIRFN